MLSDIDVILFSFKECKDFSSARSSMPFQRFKPPTPKFFSSSVLEFWEQIIHTCGQKYNDLLEITMRNLWNSCLKEEKKKPHNFFIKSCCNTPLQILESALDSSNWNSRIYEKKPFPHKTTFFSLQTTVMLLNRILSHFWKSD